MKSTLLALLAETPLHPGSGRSLGVVDLPVAREGATDLPFLPGSGLKGALRERAESGDGAAEDVERVFGRPDWAGDLLVADGRLLLLPVRSLQGSYRWATCPLLLERLGRDLARAGFSWAADLPAVSQPEPRKALGAGHGDLFLEERRFSLAGELPDGLVSVLGRFVSAETTRSRLARQVVVLADEDFAWFARFGLTVRARNVLKDGTKRSVNLWYEESLPPDTLLYTVLNARRPEALAYMRSLFPQGGSYLQLGGNETTGQGWCSVLFLEDQENR